MIEVVLVMFQATFTSLVFVLIHTGRHCKIYLAFI